MKTGDAAGAPGSGAVEDGSKSVDLQMEGRELKVLTPTYLKKLIDAKLDFPQLRLKLEKEFPGYTLPSEEDIRTLKLKEKHENLKDLSSEFAEGNRFNIFTCDSDKFNRSRWSVSGGSFDQRDMNQNDREFPHLKEDDCLFLIKKTNN